MNSLDIVNEYFCTLGVTQMLGLLYILSLMIERHNGCGSGKVPWSEPDAEHWASATWTCLWVALSSSLKIEAEEAEEATTTSELQKKQQQLNWIVGHAIAATPLQDQGSRSFLCIQFTPSKSFSKDSIEYTRWVWSISIHIPLMTNVI